MITTGPPDHYLVPLGTGLDGVTSLEIVRSVTSAGCSGVLLSTGWHVLTAAHCVADASGALDVFGLTALFETAAAIDQIEYRGVAVYPGYTGDPFEGNDLAIVTLSRPAPPGADRYPVYRGSDEIGQVGQFAGYGSTGQGREDNTFPAGQRRAGFNRLDADGSAFPFAHGHSLLLYDFDNGLPRNDGFGLRLGLHDLGEGLAEVMPAHGDSGGPMFLGGAVAGLHSFSFRFAGSDIDGILNQSFGEFGADVRLSSYAAWIDSQLTVPEPPGLALVLPGLFVLALLLFRQPRPMPGLPTAPVPAASPSDRAGLTSIGRSRLFSHSPLPPVFLLLRLRRPCPMSGFNEYPPLPPVPNGVGFFFTMWWKTLWKSAPE